MKVVGLPILGEFRRSHGECSPQISAWLEEAKDARWRTPGDIKRRYASASFIGVNHVVFNIKGNKYRLDTKVYYELQTVVIVRAGTHAEYDGWRF